MKALIIALLLFAASSAFAQTVLPPGEYMVPSCGPTSTQTPTPTATATPIPTKVFVMIQIPPPPNPPGSSQWPYWYIQPANSDSSSKLVAFVNVTINGVLMPSYKGGSTGHTFDYRLGGFPIPSVTVTSGTFNWTPGPAGSYAFVFNAYNDAGQLLQSLPMQVPVP